MPSLQASYRAPNLPSTASGNIVTTAAMFVDGGGTNILVCPFPGSKVLHNRMFKLRVAGYATSGTTSTLTVSAYLVTGTPSATVASNGTAFMATSATSLASIGQAWWLEATCMYDATHTKIQGNYSGNIAGTAVALTTLTTTSLLAVSDTAETQNFCLSVLFGTTEATNTAVVTEFELEPL